MVYAWLNRAFEENPGAPGRQGNGRKDDPYRYRFENEDDEN